MNAGLQYGLYLVLLVVLAWPLGKYLYKVMNGERVLLTPVLRPIEKGIYRLMRIDENEDMGWKRYAIVCVLFNLFGFLALWAIQMLQSVLPLNPEGMPGTSWHLGFNTAASFMTNTNWQAYSGETTLSYFTQMLGLCVRNFVSPAVGIAVMFALIRGLSRVRQHGIGYNGLNSAHPLENPTPLSNLGEMLALLLIPAACCFAFGYGVKDKKQGVAIFLAMFILLVAAVGFCALSEHAGTPQLAQSGAVANPVNMEGKETRFGIPTSVTWATWTTAASNGSVNSMHDSYTPLGGLVPMLLMQLGEVVFGGVGCGLYGMIGFVILTVFIAGLMVGHTPEYLGKKIEAREMKMAVLVCLATPVACLIGAGIACMLPSTVESLNNAGAHGFSEVLYAYSSGAGNNGSAFAGFNANTPFLNVSIGLVMIFVRFVPMLATLAIAGSMVVKKRIAESAGTLSTSNGMFVFLLIFIVLLVGALSFFPALALGPIAEHFLMLG